jgi:DNA-binding response OmpR family regulator
MLLTASPLSETSPAAADASRRKILLVDDSSTSHMWVRMILSKASFDMISARDGQEGVELALRELPDLILMDVIMPQMDGFEAVRRLRQVGSTRGIPVIMVTTRGEARNVQEGFASGCSDYVTKPIDGLELLTKIRSFLPE